MTDWLWSSAESAVSQFTLYANLRKGSKPDFHGAKVGAAFFPAGGSAFAPPAPPPCTDTRVLYPKGGDDARQMYHEFLEDLRTKYQADKVLDGKVGSAAWRGTRLSPKDAALFRGWGTQRDTDSEPPSRSSER